MGDLGVAIRPDRSDDVLIADASGWVPATVNGASGYEMRNHDDNPHLWDTRRALPDLGRVEITGSRSSLLWLDTQQAASDVVSRASAGVPIQETQVTMPSLPYTAFEEGWPGSSAVGVAGFNSSNLQGAPTSPLPPSWNMRDASATSFERDRQAFEQDRETRLLNSPSVGEWVNGPSVLDRLNQTASVIDAIRTPGGALGFLVGRASGMSHRDSAGMAMVGSVAGEILSLRASGPKTRPTWRQSELDVGARLEQDAYRSQMSFKNGMVVPYGTKGSTRPDYFGSGGNSSIEVKNYNIETALGRDRLITNVTDQASYRAQHLPAGASQTIYLDVRGQNISRQQLNELIDNMIQRSNGSLQRQNIMTLH